MAIKEDFFTVSRLFGLASPFVAQLANYWKPLPMTLLGVLSILSTMSVYFLPDTKNQSLPQVNFKIIQF